MKRIASIEKRKGRLVGGIVLDEKPNQPKPDSERCGAFVDYADTGVGAPRNRCGRDFMTLSGNVQGCPVHGIQAALPEFDPALQPHSNAVLTGITEEAEAEMHVTGAVLPVPTPKRPWFPVAESPLGDDWTERRPERAQEFPPPAKALRDVGMPMLTVKRYGLVYVCMPRQRGGFHCGKCLRGVVFPKSKKCLVCGARPRPRRI